MCKNVKAAISVCSFILFLAVAVEVKAGGLLQGKSGCGCHGTPAQSVYVPAHQVVHHHMPSAPAVHAGCACSSVASTCCGLTGLQGFSSMAMTSAMDAGMGWHHGDFLSGYEGGSLTGYEGLPNMDGGGVNHRYPYHSYRRPWFHPGPQSANISIVW